MRITLEKFAEETGEELIFLDGYDSAIVGIIKKANHYSVLYDTNIILSTLMQDMSEDDAYEWFSFNIESAWFGNNTPAFTCNIHEFMRN